MKIPFLLIYELLNFFLYFFSPLVFSTDIVFVIIFPLFADKKQTGWKSYGITLPDCVLLKSLHKELKDKKDPFFLTADNLNQVGIQLQSSIII